MANTRKLQRNALSFTPRADAMDSLENLSDPFAVGIVKRSRGPYFGGQAGAGGAPGDGVMLTVPRSHVARVQRLSILGQAGVL